MSKTEVDGSRIHAGHRCRMKDKLLSHGARIFATYELLEMLLYHSVPYKDTNPLAKQLLSRFAGLGGVLMAEHGALTEVSGIGESTARLIKLVDKFSSVIGAEILPEGHTDFTDYSSVGRLFVEYFDGRLECATVAVFLDNSMNLIAIEEPYALDFSSGGVKAKPFIDGAIKYRASVVITAHNHPYGPFCPTDGDRATGSMLSDALSKVGVLHAEHYLISGSSYAGISAPRDFVGRFSQTIHARDFYDSKLRAIGASSIGVTVPLDTGDLPRSREVNYNSRDLNYFAELLSYATKDSTEVALKILKRYRTIEGAITAPIQEMTELTDKKVALFLKLVGYIAARRREDGITLGKIYTEAELAEYMKAVFIGQSAEQVYLLSFDEGDALISVDFLFEGTVNTTDILPRRILELSVQNGARSISVAHNHPFGSPTPSGDDLSLTSSLSSVLTSAEINFKSHYIVAGQLCTVIDVEEVQNAQK